MYEFAPRPINFSGVTNFLDNFQQGQRAVRGPVGPDGLPIGPNNGQYDPNWTGQVRQPGFLERAQELMNLSRMFGGR